MRRTPTFIWIPFVFSIGTISWAFLLAGLILLAAVIITPAAESVKTAEAQRNNFQASSDILDQEIARNDEFLKAARDRDIPLMRRLADRQLNIMPHDRDTFILYPAARDKDRSVKALIAESLTPVTPKPVVPLPAMVETTVGNPSVRPLFIIIACAAIAISFFLGVKYERA